jgi:hypothetical protein
MSWKEETSLRDLDDTTVLEVTCMRCRHNWRQSPVELLLKVIHRDVRLDEVEKNLSCPKRSCRHVGTRVTLLKKEDTSGFVGGMP